MKFVSYPEMDILAEHHIIKDNLRDYDIDNEHLYLLISNLLNLSIIYSNKSEWEKSLNIINKALKLYIKYFEYNDVKKKSDKNILKLKIKLKIHKGKCQWNFNRKNSAINTLIEAKDLAANFNYINLYADVLGYLSDMYEQKGDYNKAYDFYNKELELREELSDTYLISESYIKIGIMYSHRGVYDKALNLYKKSIELKEKLNDRYGLAKPYKFIGNVYKYKELKDESIKAYKISLEIYEEFYDKENTVCMLEKIGKIHYKDFEYSKAYKYFGRALEIYKELGNKEKFSHILNYIGLIKSYKGNYKEAIKDIKNAIGINERLNKQDNIPLLIINLARIYYVMGDLDSALDYYLNAYNIFEKSGDLYNLAFILNAIGFIYYYKDDFKKAKNFIESALKLRMETGDELAVSKSLDNMGVLIAGKEDYKKAIKYHKKSFHIKTKYADKQEIGHNYAYLSYAYMRLGKYREALSTALLHIRNMKEIGKDVEHGKTLLVIALILAYGRELDETEKSTLATISSLTKIPPSPFNYYENAISEAKKTKYRETLIPALYEYGKFLYTWGKQEEGIKYISEAKNIASNEGIILEQKKIKRLCNKIGLKYSSI